MAKIVCATVFLLLLGVAIIQAQICRPYTVTLRPGQRICIRNCAKRPSACITATKTIQIQTCPPGCCRSGSGCQSLRSANSCQIQIRMTTPGQRICELKCRPPGQMPVTECYTPRSVYRAVVCPRYCCRLEGPRCRQIVI